MAHEAHAQDAHGQDGHGKGQGSQLIEQILFVVLLGAGLYALFGPKSPPTPKEEATAAAAPVREVAPARAMPSGRQPVLASSALSPQALAEMQQIQAARRAIQQGNPDDALKELKSYDQKFPGGRLTDDATLLRVEANLKKGDRQTAQKLAAGLISKSPDSRQAKRAQKLLAAPAEPAPAR